MQGRTVSPDPRMQTNSLRARMLIGCVVGFGGIILVRAFANWQSENIARFICFFALTALSSGMKVSLPSVTGTVSVAFLFSLIGIEELTLPETLCMVGAAALLQCLWRPEKRPLLVQVGFNVASVAIAVYVCTLMYHSWLTAQYPLPAQLRLIIVACAYFVLNTFPVAAVISFTENRPLGKTWHECYTWSLPYYLLGAVVAGGVSIANRMFGWEMTVLTLPAGFLIYRSYRLYLSRLTDEKRHAEEQKHHAEDIAALHLRTIEALALAIEAKDHSTHAHLRRVQTYALEIGKEMGLNGVELDALRAAALLHDIGKLAVPEHIISKPGKLTPEEFEKMKIHPIVGAEILEQVKFPYPVVPIVRAHHEKWNGKGYPYGLKGEEIPLGARILAVVDCMDALVSDRQYRRGLPPDEAMSVILLESGKSYDPVVVGILHRRFAELEQLAQSYQADTTRLSTDLKIEKGREPASGFESSGAMLSPPTQNGDFMQSIAAARHEVQALFEMSQDLGNSLSVSVTLSVLAVKLKRVIPHDSIAIYIVRDGKLIPEHVSGDDFRLFSSLEIPIGMGLSGWVAENRKSIINGNPSVEPGYMNDPEKFSMLRSALAVPLEGVNGVIGVLTLYHTAKDAFTRDHLRIVMALSSKVSLAIENALKFRQVENSATTDFLTGLPNARSLFLHLDSQIARSKRTNGKLAVLVCDLDGFKQVNDRYGHLQGNRVLQLIAEAIQSNCRESDYVARMGGDEFVLVLPGFDPGSLDQKVEQLSRLVAAVGREVCGEDVVALSVGAAFYKLDGVDAEQILAEADRRMYKEKHVHKQQRPRATVIELPRGKVAARL